MRKDMTVQNFPVALRHQLKALASLKGVTLQRLLEDLAREEVRRHAAEIDELFKEEASQVG